MSIEQKLAGYRRLSTVLIIAAFIFGVLFGFVLNINAYMAGIPACL